MEGNNKENENDNEVVEDNDNKEFDEIKEEELSLTDSNVTKLYNYTTGLTEEVGEYFRSSKTLTNKTVSDKIKLMSAFYSFNLNKEIKTDKPLSATTVVNYINKIYGDNNGYNHITEGVYIFGINSNTDGCGNVKYNSNTDSYVFNEYEGCGGTFTSWIASKLVKVVKTKDTIVLTEKIYQVSAPGIVTKNSITQEVISNNYDENNKDSYFESGSTVTYTFKLDKNNNYYFESSNMTY